MSRPNHPLRRAPRLVLTAWVILVAVAAALALQLDGALSGGGFTAPRAEALVTQAGIERDFGDAPNQVVVVLDGDDGISPAAIDETTALLAEHGAVSVTTPGQRPDYASADGRTVVITAGFDGDNTVAQNLTPDLQEGVSDLAGGVDGYVTGQPALDYQLNAHSKEDALRAELIVFPVLIVVLLIVFRSVAAAVVPLLIAGSSLAIALGAGYLIARETDVSNLYSNIVSMIGLAVSVDYSLFIVKRFREELSHGRSVRDAVDVAMARAGHSVLFSGAAVIVALAALLVPRVMAFTSIALGGMIVTAVALVLTHTVLPSLLILLGRRIDWGRVPLPSRRPRRASGSTAADSTSTGTGLRGRPSPTRAMSAVVALVGVVGLLAVSSPALGLSLQSPVASATVLPEDDPARIGLDVAAARIGVDDLFPLQVVIGADDASELVDDVAKASRLLQEHADVASVTSVTTSGIDPALLPALLASDEAPAELGALWAEGSAGTVARLLVTTDDGPDSVEAHDLVREIRDELPDELGSSSTVAVAGATAQGLDFDETLVDSLPTIAVLVFVATFLLLIVAFRSVTLSLLALAFNALVVGASLGALTLVQSLTSDVPLNSVTPVLLFAVMFGLSMDYMVIIIARIAETYERGAVFGSAVTDGLRATRPMINSAALIMIVVFLAFMTGQISIVREIGLGLAIAVALDAVVIRTIVLPSVLRAIGPGVFGARSRRRRSQPQTAGGNLVS
ncbi:MMPL family transporter [Frigoribacterium sp. CFBP 13712]|uniref:MMPL family transporter n=1 Tax=Frigoribacterium sp. CFBP 13712 TaxID=2775309 RepID=UPI00177CF138|nr:MMPL family transporter [Frigoribacterium sp. CFBP 13712]MBD8704942.1 MMPL family transporter [Frigoribacterium sp. CFBP 13712]